MSEERDPRENRLPAWVQAKLSMLRRDLQIAEDQYRSLDAENGRLRDLVEGKAKQAGDSNTFLVNDDTGAELPLGQSPDITFGPGRTFQVHYGTHPESGGEEVLVVESDGMMLIQPTGWVQSVLVRRPLLRRK